MKKQTSILTLLLLLATTPLAANYPDVKNSDFDLTKSIWDDTDWRQLGLRGRVKQIVRCSDKIYEWQRQPSACDTIQFTSFGKKAYQSKTYAREWFEYDDEQRLVKQTSKVKSNANLTITTTERTYTYGNHGKYVELFSLSGMNEGLRLIKNLVAVSTKHTSNVGDRLRDNYTFDFKTNNTVVLTYNDTTLLDNGNQIIENRTAYYTYQGAYPLRVKKLLSKIYSSSVIEPHLNRYTSTIDYVFDKTTGIHLSIKAVHSTGEKQSCTYARNSPFWSQLSESVTTDKGVVSKHRTKYNANWEIITPDMTYSGYDKHNNWTHLQLSEGGYIHQYITYYDTPAIVIEDVQITE